MRLVVKRRHQLLPMPRRKKPGHRDAASASFGPTEKSCVVIATMPPLCSIPTSRVRLFFVLAHRVLHINLNGQAACTLIDSAASECFVRDKFLTSNIAREKVQCIIYSACNSRTMTVGTA